MPAVAVALRGGQGSESAVRLGNDNIGHARPPRTCGTLTRVSTAAFAPASCRNDVDLPRAWCARSVSSFCVALFCKTSGSTRTMWSRKKNVARPSKSLCLAREMAESTECPTCSRGVGVARTVRRRFPPAPRRPTRRLADHGRLDDSGTNRRARSHCLHASHWIVIFVGARRRRAHQTARCIWRYEKTGESDVVILAVL